MTTTSFRSRSAELVMNKKQEHRLICTRKAGNDILPWLRGGGYSSPFLRQGTTLCRRLESKVL
ncbi:UNVERIFIED_CONTAM: hypothetical protein NCL1_59945 [Trichonephila clavipes]